jgi:hypothetical protein
MLSSISSRSFYTFCFCSNMLSCLWPNCFFLYMCNFCSLYPHRYLCRHQLSFLLLRSVRKAPDVGSYIRLNFATGRPQLGRFATETFLFYANKQASLVRATEFFFNLRTGIWREVFKHTYWAKKCQKLVYVFAKTFFTSFYFCEACDLFNYVIINYPDHPRCESIECLKLPY